MASEVVQLIFTAEDRTRAAFNQVRGALNGLGDQLVSVRGIIATLGTYFGARAFAEGIKSASEAADATAKMSDRFGIATEKMAGLTLAAQLGGGSIDSVQMGLRTAAYQATQAAEGLQQSQRAFDLLHINAQEFLKLPMDQQFKTIIERLKETDNVAIRNAVGQQLLGRSYGELAGLIADGSAAIDDATKNTQAFGLALNRVDSAKIEMANDSLTTAQTAVKGVFTQMSLYLSPAIYGIATAFAEGAKETHGFDQTIRVWVDNLVTGIGYVANVVQGLRFAWGLAKLAVAEFIDFAVTGLTELAEAVQGSKIMTALEYLPGPLGLAARAFGSLASNSKESLQSMREATHDSLAAIKGDLDALAEQGLPKDKLLAKWEEVKKIVEQKAKEIAAVREKMNQGSGTLPSVLDDSEQKWRADLAKRVNRIQIQNQTEFEKLQDGLIQNQNAIDLAHQNGLLSDEEYHKQRELLELNHQAALGDVVAKGELDRRRIAQLSMSQQLAYHANFLGTIVGEAAAHNKQMFEINKLASLGTALVKGWESIQSAYAWGSSWGGPFGGAAMAALAAAATAVQIRAIQSAQFGGGATPVSITNPSTGLSATSIAPQASGALAPPSVAQAQTPPPKQDISVTFVGKSPIDYDTMVNEFIPLINQAGGNGVNINVRTV